MKHTLQLDNPKLWWPAGYGEPNLYDVSCNSRRGRTRFPTPSVSRPACASSPTARRAARCGSGSTAGASFPGRQLGLRRIHAALPRARIRRGGALPRGDELHHDPQLGGADRRRRILRSLRPARHRGVAGFLAGQSVGRSRPGRQRHVPAQREGLRAAHSQPSVRSGCTCGRNEGYPPKPIDDGIRATLASCIRACTTSPVRPTMW